VRLRGSRLPAGSGAGTQTPHRSKYLKLGNAFIGRLLDLHLELIDSVERELGPAANRRGAALAPDRNEDAGGERLMHDAAGLAQPLRRRVRAGSAPETCIDADWGLSMAS
jgi:hypothetical protein